MTHRTVEPLLILAVTLAAGAAAAVRPQPFTIELGRLVLLCSALLLLQSLLRDLWLLRVHRRKGGPGERREARCMCIESLVGAAGVVVGLLLPFVLASAPLQLPAWVMVALLAATLVIGFLVKDLVIQWRPWALRRDPDHVNIIVRW